MEFGRCSGRQSQSHQQKGKRQAAVENTAQPLAWHCPSKMTHHMQDSQYLPLFIAQASENAS
jgi:hypothetical protein